MKIEHEMTIELDISVTADWKAGRPAPICSDHDAPGFSDPGDAPEVDDVKVFVDDVEITKYLPDDIVNTIIQDLLEKYDG